MLEILEFIFSSFWVWAGTVLLVWVTADSLSKWIGFIGQYIRRRS